MSPSRLWSLWDMLKHSASFYVIMGALFERFGADFRLDKMFAGLAKDLGALPTPVQFPYDKRATPEDTKTCLESIATFSDGLKLSVFSKIVHQKIKTLPVTAEEVDQLRDIFTAELESLLFLFVPQHVAQYYEWDGIVSQQVVQAFPAASGEIRSAGNCYAAGLNTACVFHSMRAAEIGVRALANALGVTFNYPIELAEFGKIVGEIEPKLEAMKAGPRSAQKANDLRFYSEAAAQFRYFNNGWRIRVSHANANYSEDQARSAIDHVRSFFETLAERLSEAQVS